MPILDSTPSPWAGRVLSVFRIVAGLLFVSFGSTKLFNFPPHEGMPMPLLTQVGIGGLLELAGGLAIALGLFTKPVAFVLSGEMAVAYFQFHAPQSFFPSVNNGVPAVLFCFFYFYLVFAGPGDWSLDALRASGRSAPRVRAVPEP